MPTTDLMENAPDLAVIEQTLRAQVSVAQDARDKAVGFESELLKLPQIQLPLQHYFSRGVYAREMTCPAGTAITGRIHKYSQINILSKGKVSVLTDDGVITVSAPYTLVAQPGAKRAFYVHEEAVWTTICGTQTTDIEQLEQELTVGTYEEFSALALEHEKGN